MDNLNAQKDTVIKVARCHELYADVDISTTQVDMFMDTVVDYYGNLLPVDTLVFNKRGYEAWERIVNRFEYSSDEVYIYCSYDVSGYSYWTKCNNESNYMHICVTLKQPYMDCEKLFRIVDDYLCELSSKYLHLLDCKTYIRKEFANV